MNRILSSISPGFVCDFVNQELDEFLMNTIWDANPKHREASRKIVVQRRPFFSFFAVAKYEKRAIQLL